jgi:hypothetical protein
MTCGFNRELLKGVTGTSLSTTSTNLRVKRGQLNSEIQKSGSTYMVLLTTGAVPLPKISPPGCCVNAVVPDTFTRGVYVTLRLDIHAANYVKTMSDVDKYEEVGYGGTYSWCTGRRSRGIGAVGTDSFAWGIPVKLDHLARRREGFADVVRDSRRISEQSDIRGILRSIPI